MQGGRYEPGSLESELLPQTLEYQVYLPPCYDQYPERRYPVIYLIHGQSYSLDQWDRLGVDEISDRLVASGDLPQFLIVMPRDRVWTQPDTDPFGRALVQDLIPRIDASYRTLPDREHRAIGGLSRGAAWALHLGLSQWEQFGAIGMHSLPVFWADTPEIRQWLAAIPDKSMPRFYMDIGSRDRPAIMKSAIWFEQLLTERNIPHEWHLFEGYHEEAYWEAHAEQYLRWYTREW
jgi:enterochelin esterase-like enzyme